ncbi:MAG TPA: helix-turn-helix domain-containing protein [Pseudonocardiaceae bacterium]|jgi:hypothetical protein|nr:helix-turn-helix domain-containing protein [Pseudonocardiaceae bacterium]
MTGELLTVRRRHESAMGTMTFPELFRLPATINITTAAKAFGIHVNTAYKLVRRDAFPCPVFRVGWQYRVPTKALLLALHIDEIPVRRDDVVTGADLTTRYIES